MVGLCQEIFIKLTKSMLQRYLSHDRPSFIVSVISLNNTKTDYCCHVSGVECSKRFRYINNKYRTNLQEFDANTPEPPQKRTRRNGEMTRIIEFHIEWLPAYKELCPNDPDPFTWFLMHLHGYEEAIGALATSTTSFCPIDDLLDSVTDAPTDIICTYNVETSVTVPKLVVMLELFQWFYCPPNIYNHIIKALMQKVRYTGYSVSLFTYLPSLCPPAYLPHISLLEITVYAYIDMFRIVTLPDSQIVHSSLQTFGLDMDENNNDIANFLDDYTCEFLLNHRPLLYMLSQLNDSTFMHVTEAALSDPDANNVSMFEFGALRDFDIFEHLCSAKRYSETIRLRSHTKCIEITWKVTRNNTIEITTLYTSTNRIKARPYIELQMGVLNVGEGDDRMNSTNVFDDQYSRSCQTSSIATDTARIEFEEKTTIHEYKSQERYTYIYTWSLGYNQFDAPTILDQTFIMRGSVHFYNSIL